MKKAAPKTVSLAVSMNRIDITKGDCTEPSKCAVALATLRAARQKFGRRKDLYVSVTYSYITVHIGDTAFRMNTPRIATTFMSKFDEKTTPRNELDPIKFKFSTNQKLASFDA